MPCKDILLKRYMFIGLKPISVNSFVYISSEMFNIWVLAPRGKLGPVSLNAASLLLL